MFGESWCDISDDLGLDGMPELPPILEPAFSAPASPEKSATRESEESSTAGSAVNDNQDDSATKESTRSFVSRSRFRFDKFEDTPSQSKTCFIGQMPPNCSIEDFRTFVELKGVSVTEIRLGPRKKTNSSSFGYVDLTSDADFHKLIAEDGTMYQGRKIRIDQATPHKKSTTSRGSAVTHSSRKPAHHFGARKGLRADLRRINSAPMPRPGRANRFLHMNRGKTGSRNFQKRAPKGPRRRQARSENFKNRNNNTTNNTSNWRYTEGGNSRSRLMRN